MKKIIREQLKDRVVKTNCSACSIPKQVPLILGIGFSIIMIYLVSNALYSGFINRLDDLRISILALVICAIAYGMIANAGVTIRNWKKKMVWEFISFYAYTSILVWIYIFIYTLVGAYFNGGEIKMIVNINNHNEMFPEVIAMVSTLPLATYFVVTNMFTHLKRMAHIDNGKRK